MKILLVLFMALFLCNCVYYSKKETADYGVISDEVYQRAMEPFVIGGETDTLLYTKIESQCLDLGDDGFSSYLQALPAQRRGAFRFFLTRGFLERRSFWKTIATLSMKDYPIYPAAKAANKAFGQTPKEYLKEEFGW